MVLKFKKHWYDKPSNETIELPDDTVFIYKKGDIGNSCHIGYNHYLAATKSKFKHDNKITCTVISIQEITFVIFNDVLFESKIPLISGKEFYKKFELDTYYIFNSRVEDVKFNPETNKFDIVPSKLMSITKILSIEGPYFVKVISAYINPWLGDREFLCIRVEEFLSFYKLIANNSHLKVEIKKNCEQEFIDAINKTLELVNYKVVSDQPLE